MLIDFYDSTLNHFEFQDDNYFYQYEDNDEDIFYVKIDDKIYRKLRINRLKSDARFVNMKSINNNYIHFIIDRFKQQNDF